MELGHFCARRALVEQVDRLIRQKFVRQVAAGQLDRRLDRTPGNGQSVVLLQAGPQALQDSARLLLARLAHLYGTKAPLQRRVLFDKFTVFLQRGRADQLHLSAPQRGLEQIGRVDRALSRARTDQRVHFVDKQDHIFCPLHLREDVAHTLLKFAAVFCPRDDACHIQREKPLSEELLRHLPGGDILRHALDDRRFADARLTDQRGVILMLARKDLQNRFDLPSAADHRLRVPRPFHHIHTELLQESRILHRLLLSDGPSLA